MRQVMLCLILSAVSALGATLAQTDATGPKDELTWHDAGAFLCGRGFAHTTHPYGRLDPADTNRLTAGVRWHGLDSAGLCLRFRTDSRRLAIRWRLMKTYEGGNMNRFGNDGMDVYRRTADGWHFVGAKGGMPGKTNELVVAWRPNDEALVYLPLYNGAVDVRVGTLSGARTEACGEQGKPVVFYGTSITQGGCASRPGMAYTAILQRRLNVPVVNMGFSGSGCMEDEMAETLAKIDAAAYVIDTMWNIGINTVSKGRYESFVRRLRKLRPDVPILLMNDYHFAYHGRQTEKGAAAEKLFARLRAEPAFAKGFALVDGSDLYDREGNGTVDGTHPDSVGMMRLADAIGPRLAAMLQLVDGSW